MKQWKILICFILWFILPTSLATSQDYEIRILYVNDFHGFAEPYKPLGSDELHGGIAYLAAKVDKLRKEKPSLFLAAGDMIQGNNWANLFQGESVIELMNEMGFDAMVLGNHEFDFGQEVLKKRISETKFPVLGANVERLESLKPYVIKELEGVKVAIIGLVTEDTPISTHPKNVSGLIFLSPIDTLLKKIKEVKKKADIVVVLSHLGHPVDRILAERVMGIDLIVGGHTHSKITKPVRIGNTIIVQAWEHAKALGVLDLTLRNGKMVSIDGHLEEVKPKMGEENKVVFTIVEKYRQKVDAVLNERVGEAEVDLDGENVRRRETNLGNLIADIMRYTSGADVAVINGGAIRKSIRKGEMSVRDVYNALPFDNYIVAFKLTGRQIKEALEHGVSTAEEKEGRFPQISGLHFKYVLSGKKGSRVKEILIAGKPIDPDKDYILATNDYLAAGGDGYKVFGEALKTSRDFPIIGGMMKGEEVVYTDSGRWLRDVAVEYIKGMKRIAPTAEDRIIEIP